MRASTLRAERPRIQALFDRFNAGGGLVSVVWPLPDGVSLDLGLGVEFVVTRVAQDDGGLVVFWLRWKQANYTEDQHGTHTVLVVREPTWGGDALELVDDIGRLHRITPAPAELWERWLHWRDEHAEDIRAADRLVNPEHDRIAAQWGRVM